MSIPGILTFVLVLSVLVFFHELGHFLFAKLFRMKVEEFAIGFGEPKLRVYYDGETEYNLRAFPLGGFVRIKGMEIEDATERRLTGAKDAPATPDAGDHGFTTTNAGTLAQETAEVSGADADGFNNRPIYQRFWVILGGPLFSFLLGYLLFCLLGATFGIPKDVRQTTFIAQVVGGKPAARGGIRAGDTILSLNGKPVATGEAMVETLHSLLNQPIAVSFRTKKGETRTVTVTAESQPDPAQPGKRIGLIGVQPAIEYGEPVRLSLAESFAFGTAKTGEWFAAMGQVLSSPKLFGESVGGPVEILKASDTASKAGGTHIVDLIAKLSLSLGLFNLFPIPVLDGGHLALMALEKIRGRKLTAEQTGRVFMVGFTFIAASAIFIIGRGVYRLFVN